MISIINIVYGVAGLVMSFLSTCHDVIALVAALIWVFLYLVFVFLCFFFLMT